MFHLFLLFAIVDSALKTVGLYFHQVPTFHYNLKDKFNIIDTSFSLAQN